MQTSVSMLNLEEVKEEYREKDAIGIPMSVRERYERALAEIRKQIREARRNRQGKRLGELLVERGVLDRERLQQALAEQKRRGKGELLGEVLISLGLTDKETLLAALRSQITGNQWIRRDN